MRPEEFVHYDRVEVTLVGRVKRGERWEKIHTKMVLVPLNAGSVSITQRRPYKAKRSGKKWKFVPYDFMTYDLSMHVKSAKLTKK